MITLSDHADENKAENLIFDASYLETGYDYKEHKKQLEDIAEKDRERKYKMVKRMQRMNKVEEPNVLADKEFMRRERYNYLQGKTVQ